MFGVAPPLPSPSLPGRAWLGDKNKKKPSRHLSDGFVGLPGFEPGMTGPESVVLPLHHSPIWIVVIFDTAKVEYYFYSAKKIATFFRFLCDFLSATSLKSFFAILFIPKNNPIFSTLCIRAPLHRPTLHLHGLRIPNAR